VLGLFGFIYFKFMQGEPKLCSEVLDEWYLFVKEITDEANNHGYRYGIAMSVASAASAWTTWNWETDAEYSCTHWSGQTSVKATTIADFIRDKSN
jgi:hypothetical protein